ncbi:MAG: HAD-IA family hydrolase [Parcubacteria group bacterium]
MIKLVIFDLDGVVIKNSSMFSDFLLERYDVTPDDIYPIFKNQDVKKGKVDTYEAWKPYLDRLRINLPKEKFFKIWFEGENPKAVEDIVEVAIKVKELGYAIIILSDQSKERGEFLKNRFDFMKEFDKVYFSNEIGYTKMEGASFKKILEDYDFEAEDVLFIDDKQKFIDVASGLGIKAFLYESPEKLVKDLKNVNIDVTNND